MRAIKVAVLTMGPLFLYAYLLSTGAKQAQAVALAAFLGLMLAAPFLIKARRI